MIAFVRRASRLVPLESSSKKLLALYTAVALATGLSNLFVGVYFWRLLSSFQMLAWYNLALFAGITVVAPLAAVYIGKKGTRSIIRLGIILQGIFFLAILLLGEKTGVFILPLGILNGVANAAYWTGMNVQTSRVCHRDQHWYFSLVQAVLAAVAIAGPPISGFVINLWPDYTGYSVVFGLSALCFLVAFVLVFFLTDTQESFRFSQVLTLTKNDPSWKRLSRAIFIWGFRQGVFDALVGVLVFITLKNELALGNFTMFVSLVAILFSTVTGRFIKNQRRPWFFLAGTLSLTLGITCFVVFQSPWALIVYGAMEALGRGPWNVAFDSYTWSSIAQRGDERAPGAPGRLEYIIHREFFLEGGRMAGLSLFLILALVWEPVTVVRFLFPGLCLVFAATFFLLKKVEKARSVPV